MWKDEIIEEIYRIREEHAKSFNYELKAMFADWQKRQFAGGRQVVRFPAKQRANKTLPGTVVQSAP